jgi:hypothetical protein
MTTMPDEFGRTVETVARDLVRVQGVNGTSFLNLPMLYPDGSSVTVRIDQIARGSLRVSDNGFAYREAEDANAVRSFGQNKKGVADEFGVQFGGKMIFTTTSYDGLFEAICDVSAASWQIASRVYSRLSEDAEPELEEEVSERLKRLFNPTQIQENKDIAGASTVPWPVSAVVTFPDHRTIFQVVGEHPNSINRSATAFRDLALLPKPPRLIAVVRNKKALGPRLTLLAQAPAKIIERENPDNMWKDAA